MTETNTEINTRIINHVVNDPHREPPPDRAEHAAGNGARPPLFRRNHHRGNNNTRPRPVSQEQRQKLSAAQKAYVASDPRWAEHRKKLADAQIARRMTLLPDELAMVLALRSKGRTFSYIQEEIGVCHDVIRRELAERGYSTAPIRSERRAKRGKGHWRSFD